SFVKAALPGDYVNPTTISATIEDTSGWSAMGKYVFELGDSFKDGGSGPKLTVYAGFQRVDISNPKNPVAFGATGMGGYTLGNVNALIGAGLPSAGSLAATVNNLNFGSTLTEYTEWTGLKYEVGNGWSLMAAYWRIAQDSYIANKVSYA